MSTCFATSATEYLLDTGDRLRIRVQDWPDITGEFMIAADGTVPIASIGAIEARGLSTQALSQAIGERLRQRSPGAPPPVSIVDIIRYRSFFILGDVQKPGEYEFQPQLTITKAISIASGFYRPPVAGFQRFERDAILARGEATRFSAKADRLRIQLARLQAELDGRSDLVIPEALSRPNSPEVRSIIDEAQRTLLANRKILSEAVAGHQSAKVLLEQEIHSLTQQISSETQQLDYVRRELDKMRGLAERGLASSPRMLDLERNTAQIVGARHALETSIVRARQELHRLDQKIREVQDNAASSARNAMQGFLLELDQVQAQQRTQSFLASEAEMLGPSALMRLETSPPQYRFVISRSRSNGLHQEFSTHRHSEVQPGDVIEVVRIPSEGQARSASYDAQ